MGIKKNFVYNIILTLSSYIISLIVFPYVARTLGVEAIGRVDFSNNVITYFSLFSLMGVSTVGIREIASAGDDRKKRSVIFSSILGFVLLLTAISVTLFVVSIFCFDKLYSYRNLLIIGSFSLFFTSLLIEWLYQGTEQFKYISNRTIIIRILYAISIFIFVKGRDDIYVYYFLTVMSTCVNALINLFYSRKYVDFKLSYIHLFRYAKVILSLGVYKILTSMYTTFNFVYLGFVTSDSQVGFYSTSTKLFHILLGILTAFTSVMLPRMSALLSRDKHEEFKSKINYSFDLVFMFTIPIIILTVFFAPNIIMLLSGPGFEGAIMPMRIITPMLFITGIAQIFVVQILMPLKKDSIILLGSIIGAIVGIASNIVLVKEYGAVGTALTLLLSELSCALCAFIYVTTKEIIKFPWRKMMNYLLASIPYVILCYIAYLIIDNYIYSLLISVILSALYYIFLNVIIIKNTLVINFINSLKARLK